MNNTVIGPISAEDWTTMRLLRGSVTYLSQKDKLKYKKCIDKEKVLYKEHLEKYCKAA